MVESFLTDIGEQKRNEIVLRGYGFDCERKESPYGEHDVSNLWITPEITAQEWMVYHETHKFFRMLCKPCNQGRKRKSCE